MIRVWLKGDFRCKRKRESMRKRERKKERVCVFEKMNLNVDVVVFRLNEI